MPLLLPSGLSEPKQPLRHKTAVRAFASAGMAAVDPGYVAIMARQLHHARDTFGPWLRASRDLPEHALAEAHRRFIKSHLPVDALGFSPKARYL